MSRRLIRGCIASAILAVAAPSFAQDPPALPPAAPTAAPPAASTAGPSAQDALDAARDAYGPPPPVADCSDAEAPTTDNVIVVCRRKVDQSQHRLRSDDQAETDYAEATQFAGDPQAPDVAGAGIFRGKATVGGMCFVPPCPPPPAVLIDVEALPEAPAGSDADRIARGLAPLDED